MGLYIEFPRCAVRGGLAAQGILSSDQPLLRLLFLFADDAHAALQSAHLRPGFCENLMPLIGVQCISFPRFLGDSALQELYLLVIISPCVDMFTPAFPSLEYSPLGNPSCLLVDGFHLADFVTRSMDQYHSCPNQTEGLIIHRPRTTRSQQC
jgi:hypothetical protein